MKGLDIREIKAIKTGPTKCWSAQVLTPKDESKPVMLSLRAFAITKDGSKRPTNSGLTIPLTPGTDPALQIRAIRKLLLVLLEDAEVQELLAQLE